MPAMPEVSAQAYSYRGDPIVPPFDDSRALFVFDAACVLCSGGASRLMRLDVRAKVNFASMQGVLGQSLYRHYGVDPDESYLLIASGRAFTASRGYLELCAIIGGAWHLLRMGKLIPERWRDAVYARIARNRYRWFGHAEHCARLTPQQRTRLL
jgi:predicted DCC family thiol-disulfide oxidoreductase YuxK